MKLTLLHIISFGGLNNYEIELGDGVNVLYGPNESGKSSVAMFIKFVFYGLSAKAPRGESSERDRWINRLTGQAAGYLLLEADDGTGYRIERAILTSDDTPARERVRIINRVTGETVTGQNPGEFFFGVGEDVFMNTCFVGQVTTPRPRVQALENLLTSADENVDIQKAVRTIDNVRREICHKNGSGGELADLRAERAALAEEMQRTSAASAEILRVRTSLDDITGRIRELKENQQAYNGIFTALDKLRLLRQIENAGQIERSIAELRSTLAELDASALGTGFTEAVEEAERDIRRYVEACASRSASDGEETAFPDDLPETGDEAPDDFPDTGNASRASVDLSPVESAHRLESGAHSQFTAALVLFLAGLFGFAASLLMYWFNTDAYILPLILTLACVTGGVVFIILHTRSVNALTRLLNDWNTASIEELEALFADPEELADEEELPEISNDDPDEPDNVPEPDSVPEQDDPEFLQIKERFEAALVRVSELCRTAGIAEQSDLADTLTALHTAADDIRRDREAMTAKLSNLTGKLEVLNEQLAGTDRVQAVTEAQEIRNQPQGKAAAELTPDELKTLLKERDFTDAALRSAEQRQHDLEAQLAALGTPGRTPDEAATALDELDRRIEELSLRHDACELAKTALLQAETSMRSDVIPKIAQNASILLSGATSGTHENLTLDANWEAGCSTETDILTADHLSRGTSDLAYIALRIALAEEIFKTETPFLLFDESFSHIDVPRIRSIVSLLLDGQHLVLTCRREEAEAAAAAGAGILNLTKD